jgi:hypothetical protein
MTVVGQRSRLLSAFAFVAALTSAGVSEANGRYPLAQYFALGEGAQRERIAIVATFGLLTSEDGGRTWDWTCEEAVGFSGQYDPTITITSDGTLAAGLPDGLSRTDRGNWCDWTRPATAPAEPVVDVSSAGETIVASVTPPAATQFVVRSLDHGATWTRGWARPEFYAHTIDVAPSRPARVYTTGWVRGARPALFRSEDGAGTFVEMTREFAGGYAAYVTWVDPMNADSLLVRADIEPEGALLLRSDDGGSTFRTLFRGTSALVGVAAAPGGRALWATTSAASDRVRRSTDGGENWSSVASELRPRSLRYRDGVLFATANEMTAGMSFACSRDGGDSWTPMLLLSRLRGPERCPPSSTVRARCSAAWDAIRAQLAMIPRPPVGPLGTCEEPTVMDGDAMASDASSSDAEDRAQSGQDARALDATTPDSADGATGGRFVATGGCRCSVPARPTGGGWRWWWLGLSVCVLAHSDARRRFVALGRGLR